MASEDPLYALIRALGQREKQLFKMQASRHSRKGGSKYVEAFDLLNKHRAQSDELLSQKLEQKFRAENSSVLKTYLFDSICESLISSNKKATKVQRIRFLLDEAEVLRQRGIFIPALKLIRRARPMAEHIGRFDLVREVLDAERSILGPSRGKLADPVELHGTMSEIERVTRMLLEEAIAKRVYYICYLPTHRNSKNVLPGDLKAELEREDFKATARSANPLAALYYQCAWSQYLQLTQKFEESEACLRNVLNIYKEHPGILEEYPTMYHSALHNIIGRLFLRRNLNEAATLIDQLRTAEVNTEYNVIKLFESFSTFALQYCAQSGQLLEGSLWHEAIDRFEDYDEKISNAFLVDYRLKRAIYHFNLGEIGQAIDWAHQNLSDEKCRKMPMHESLTFQVFLMAHFMYGNTELVGSKAASRLRAEKTKPFNLNFEKVLMKILLKLAENPLAENRREILEDGIEKMLDARALDDYRAYLELDLWLSTLLDKSDFTELVRSKSKDLMRIPTSDTGE